MNSILQVIKLDEILTQKSGFQRSWCVTGQTYPRKVDSEISNVLSNIGATVHKICTDIRLLSSFHEVEEPFETKQVILFSNNLLNVQTYLKMI